MVVVTHGPFCLDGMVAAACVGRLYPSSRITPIFVHPSGVDGAIDDVARASGRAKDLWITDVTWRDPATEDRFQELIQKGWRIFWIDHHTIALEKNERRIRTLGLTGWVASDRFSAAKLVYDYMMSSRDLLGQPPARLKQFKKAVTLADDNDRWIHKFPASRKLAMTVTALGGAVAYREMMRLDSGLSYSPKMRAAFDRANRDLSQSINLARRTRIEHVMDPSDLKVVVALCHGFTSEVAEALRRDMLPGKGMAETQAVFLLYSLEDERISLRRSLSCDLNLSKLAGQFGGGGHPAAAGFDLPEARAYLQSYLLERVKGALGKQGF